MAPSLKDLFYEERLGGTGLPTLEERSRRGGMIAVFQAMRRIDKVEQEDLFIWDNSDQRSW